MHATASTPVGPYQRKEQVLPAFAHEPVVVPLPESAGGGYAMWKIGCADNATTGSNGTDLVGVCTGCRNGTTQGKCPHPDQVYVSARSLCLLRSLKKRLHAQERECQDVLFAESLNGPWRRMNMTGFGRSEWDWNNVNLGLESHGPLILDNGTLLTFTRSYDAPKPNPGSAIWLVRADAWNGTYTTVDAGPAFNLNSEDTFMWQDPRGHYHALFHDLSGIASQQGVGAHAFSRDGLNWAYKSGSYYLEAAVGDSQDVFTFARRERPHLLLDDDGNPSYLTNGVVPSSGSDWR